MVSFLWHAKHELFHIVLGFAWAWALGYVWNQSYALMFLLAGIGGVLPDIDHLIYFFTYGKHDAYSKNVFALAKKHEWKSLVEYIETGHKKNTNLTFHNVYVTMFLMCCTIMLYWVDFRLSVVLLGAMVSHFIFDIIEDYMLLGALNSNWFRFGRPKSYSSL